MQTITTKYLAPTNTKGSRIKAVNSGKSHSVTLGYNYAKNMYQNHLEVAQELQDKMWWNQYTLISGSTAEGYVFVLTQGE